MVILTVVVFPLSNCIVIPDTQLAMPASGTVFIWISFYRNRLLLFPLSNSASFCLIAVVGNQAEQTGVSGM